MSSEQYANIDPATMNGMIAYVEQRRPPGGFLREVICDSLSGAMGRADLNNRRELHNIVMWFYNEAPSVCWGSPDHMYKWLENEKDEDD